MIYHYSNSIPKVVYSPNLKNAFIDYGDGNQNLKF